MRSVGLLPALALLGGVSVAAAWPIAPAAPRAILAVLCVAAIASFARAPETTVPRNRAPAACSRAVTPIVLVLAFASAGVALAAHARREVLHPSLRDVLHARFGGFDIEAMGPGGDHDPLTVEAVLLEDASPADGFVSLRVRVKTLVVDGHHYAAGGQVAVSVGGAAAARRSLEWRAGRCIRMPITFRRPARYLNDGVPDAEYALALNGTTLLGSVKSAWLVEVTARGSVVQEAAAEARAYVRRAVAARVGPYSPLSAALVTAVLIGDRTGLPDDVRERLQAAGTYHVVAISGGNIAVLTVATLAVLMMCGIRGRLAAALAGLVLLAYGQIVTAGPSVWRATLVAGVYLTARALDHRSAPWHATAVAAALMVLVHPLDVRDPGFVLTFGASAALLESARRGRGLLPRQPALSWLAASICASLAVELALLPVAAQTFSRVTSAGLVLNIAAVPLMGLAQCAGIVVVLAGGMDVVAGAAAAIAHLAVALLVGSARLVDVAPWLTTRVPAPGVVLIAAYYVAGVCVLVARHRRARLVAAAILTSCLVAIVIGAPAGLSAGTARGWRGEPLEPPGLRLTIFDVGQGESMLLESGGRALLVDAGGAPFGSSSFDLGGRVLAPALWARGIRSLDAFLFTHGDPDHVGGARAILHDFEPREVWEGVRVAAHQPTRDLIAEAIALGAAVHARRAGEAAVFGRARIRVLHPPHPDWERPRVRNDDSVVMEVVCGEVAVLLTGDVSADVERALIPALTPAAVRVLKVAHHGSRSSTSPELLDAWRPHYALISAGRGNTFGHPAPEVLRRLESIGAVVLRTDRHGQIALETDGAALRVTTFSGPP